MHYMLINNIIQGVTGLLSLMAYNALRTAQAPIDQELNNDTTQQRQKIADFIKNGTKNATIGDYDSRANGFDLQGHLQKQATKNTTEFKEIMRIFHTQLCQKLGKDINSSEHQNQLELLNNAKNILVGDKSHVQFENSYNIDGKSITKNEAANFLFQARCHTLDSSINNYIKDRISRGVLWHEKNLDRYQTQNRFALSFVAVAVQLCTAFIPNISEKAKVAINGVCLLGYLAISNTVLNKTYEQYQGQQV